jgi:hypothetical protein
MPLKKQNWDVVAYGRWNPGILTPRGIVERLFEDGEGEVHFEIEFPEDAVGPCRVNYDGMAVWVTDAVLGVQPMNPSYAELHRAMAVVHRALKDLPETPVSGVAFTVRFAGEVDGNLLALEDSIRHPWEERFVGKGLAISNRSISFSVKCGTGTILLTLGKKDELGYRVTISFRQAHNREEMLRWLSWSADEIQEKSRLVFQSILGLNEESAQ